MTSATQWLVERVESAPVLALHVRAPRLADLPYIRNSFAEGHKGAPGVSSMTWRHYNRFIRPELDAVLIHPSVEIAAAYHGADIVGWVAYTRGQRVDAIHWVHTRYRIGEDEQLRRRGIATMLLDAVQLGQRLAYTWRGAVAKSDHDKRTLDERLLPWLVRRGQYATYLPWEEWIQ